MTGFTPFSFDDSVAQTEPGRPHVPEGHYFLTKVKMEPTPENYEKTPGVFTTFRIKEGPGHSPTAGVGREIRDYSSLGGKKGQDGRGSQFGFGMLLGALGFAGVAKKLPGTAVNSYAEFKSLIEEIDQRTGNPDVVGLIADNVGNTGRPFSSIEEYMPASEWPTLKGAILNPNPNFGPRLAPPGTGMIGNGAATPRPEPTPQAVQNLATRAAALFEDA